MKQYNDPNVIDGIRTFNKEDYILVEEVDYFGWKLPIGTWYEQVNADHWQPHLNGARHPNRQITFMIVRNNPKYFIKRTTVDQLRQLKEAVWDGNLISKTCRDELVDAALAVRSEHGFNIATSKGLVLLYKLGILKTDQRERVMVENSKGLCSGNANVGGIW